MASRKFLIPIQGVEIKAKFFTGRLKEAEINISMDG